MDVDAYVKNEFNVWARLQKFYSAKEGDLDRLLSLRAVQLVSPRDWEFIPFTRNLLTVVHEANEKGAYICTLKDISWEMKDPWPNGQVRLSDVHLEVTPQAKEQKDKQPQAKEQNAALSFILLQMLSQISDAAELRKHYDEICSLCDDRPLSMKLIRILSSGCTLVETLKTLQETQP